ncbi:MAG: hypothetical protein EHM34_09105, partial [Nitrosopumilales archaeon]
MGKELTELTKVNWHAMNADRVIHYLQTRFDGLTEIEANERLGVYGFNKIKVEKGISRATI